MTTEVQTPEETYTIQATGPFAVRWPYGDDTVTATVILNGVETVLGAADFGMVPTSSDDQGDLWLTAQAAADYSGGTLYISRATPAEQGWAGTDAREKGLEAQLDLNTRILQELVQKYSTTLRTVTPKARIQSQPNSVIGFNSLGQTEVIPQATLFAQAVLQAGDLSDVIASVGIPRTAPNAAMLAATLTDGQVAIMDGLMYERRASATGAASCTADLSQDGFVPFGMIAAGHFGTAGDSAALAGVLAADGLRALEKRDFVPGAALTAPGRTRMLTADGATVNGQKLPFLSISKYAPDALPRALAFVEQDTSQNDATATFSVQRVVNTDDGITNPKALKARTVINVDTTGAEWAVSAELVSYANTSGAGHAALSGVADKYGLAQVFAGHLQAKDWLKYALATDVTSVVGLELNTPVVGLDHPTANNGEGLRIGFDLVARTNEAVTDWNNGIGNAGAGEVGVGLRIRSDSSTGGYFRTGLSISQGAVNPNPIKNAIRILTTGQHGIYALGANTVAHFLSEGTPVNGAVFNGTYSGAAVRIASGQALAMDNSNTLKMSYSAPNWIFANTGIERIGFDMSGTPRLRIAGLPVLGARKTGWATATGTASRATFDTASVTLVGLAQHVKAIIDDIHEIAGHGLFGA
jgi:hypothetical protein